jgi:hypothetical protein
MMIHATFKLVMFPTILPVSYGRDSMHCVVSDQENGVMFTRDKACMYTSLEVVLELSAQTTPKEGFTVMARKREPDLSHGKERLC